MTVQQEAGAYEPRPGERVTVRRYAQPSLTPGDPVRVLQFEFTGTMLSLADRVYHFDPESLSVAYDVHSQRPFDYLADVSADYVYLGKNAAGGGLYLVTEMGPAQPEAYRQQVSPELAVTVDPSQCIVLEVSDGQGLVLRRIAVPHVGVLKQALDAAYDAQHLAVEQAEQARLEGLRARLAERRAAGS